MACLRCVSLLACACMARVSSEPCPHDRMTSARSARACLCVCSLLFLLVLCPVRCACLCVACVWEPCVTTRPAPGGILPPLPLLLLLLLLDQKARSTRRLSSWTSRRASRAATGLSPSR